MSINIGAGRASYSRSGALAAITAGQERTDRIGVDGEVQWRVVQASRSTQIQRINGIMTVEGIWTTEILGLFGWESMGVVILEKGRAIDGGNHHYSVGSYKSSGDEIQISLAVEYHGTPRTMFGASDKNMTVELSGTIRDGIIEGNAFRADKPNQKIACKLTRRADIPPI